MAFISKMSDLLYILEDLNMGIADRIPVIEYGIQELSERYIPQSEIIFIHNYILLNIPDLPQKRHFLDYYEQYKFSKFGLFKPIGIGVLHFKGITNAITMDELKKYGLEKYNKEEREKVTGLARIILNRISGVS